MLAHRRCKAAFWLCRPAPQHHWPLITTCYDIASGDFANCHEARLLAEHRAAKLAAWDAHGRAIPSDAFAYWPACTVIPPLGDLVGVFRKRHGTVTVTCPLRCRPAREGPAVHQAPHDARHDPLIAKGIGIIK